MKWDAIAIKKPVIGLISNGSRIKRKRWLTSNKVLKLFTKILKGIRSSMLTFITERQKSSVWSRSNDISVNVLIKLLDGNDGAIRRKWYASKKMITATADSIRQEAFTHLNKSEFDKRTIVYSKIVEKQALLQHLKTELIILQTKAMHGLEVENCRTFLRFSLDLNKPDFAEKFNRLIDKIQREIEKYSKSISSDFVAKDENISFDDMITEIIITINGGMIDKNSITAKDFFIMLTKFREQNERLQHKQTR